jgi:hypothetical protein
MWESLNVTLDPEQKPHVLSGDLAVFRCPSCAHAAWVDYPILYHDMDQDIMIWKVVEGQDLGDPFQGVLPALREAFTRTYRLRLVDTWPELVEKIAIFDAGLDDRLMEIFKGSFLSRHNTVCPDGPLIDQCVFVAPVQEEGVDCFELEVHSGDRSAPARPPRSGYDAIAAALCARIDVVDDDRTGAVRRIDAAFALDLLRRLT